MSEILEIIEKMKLATDDELCELELDLFGLVYDKKDTTGMIECFLTLSN